MDLVPVVKAPNDVPTVMESWVQIISPIVADEAYGYLDAGKLLVCTTWRCMVVPVQPISFKLPSPHDAVPAGTLAPDSGFQEQKLIFIVFRINA